MQAVMMNDDDVVVMIDGRVYNVHSSHPKFEELQEAVNDRDGDTFIELFDIAEKLSTYVNVENGGRVTIDNGCVNFDGSPMHHVICDRIMSLYNNGCNLQGMVLFLENLMNNPSYNSRQQSYGFLEHKNLPITDDGCFLAYKSVCANYWSKAAGNLSLIRGTTDENGRIYNGVGEVIECDRSAVDDNPDNHCSQGLHVGSLDYSGPGGWYNSSGNKCVIVKVNPEDIVSVPNDHSCSKVRVCKYEVVGDFMGALTSTVSNSIDDVEEVHTLQDDLDEIKAPDLEGFHATYPESVDWFDEVKFQYRKTDGSVKWRHGEVVELDENHIVCSSLLDEDLDEIKSFRFDRIVNSTVHVLW